MASETIQFKNGPLTAFRFLVEVDGKEVGAFTQFSGIKMEIQTIRVRGGSDSRGVQDYVPVMSSYAPVTLTRGVVGSNEFMDWIFSAAASMNSGPSGSNLRRTLDVVALDDAGHRSVTWTLKDAMPVGYELSPMDSSRSEVLTESVTFVFTGVERTINPQLPTLPRS